MARDFSVDFAGRIRNFTLKKKDALLPLFEAIVNSLQAIEDAGKASSEGLIEVKLNRLPVLDENMSRGEITGFTVTDNGIGFDNINFESFLTSDSQLKGDRGGKGIGRFCWLKVFGDVSVDSTYREGEDLYRRQFLFSLGSTSIDDSVTDAVQKDTGTRIELRHVKREYLGYIPATGREIAERVMQHCLVYLGSRSLGLCLKVLIAHIPMLFQVSHSFRKLLHIEHFGTTLITGTFTGPHCGVNINQHPHRRIGPFGLNRGNIGSGDPFPYCLFSIISF